VPELTLARLPDRTPAKITITVPSDLNRALNEYADYLLGNLRRGRDRRGAHPFHARCLPGKRPRVREGAEREMARLYRQYNRSGGRSQRLLSELPRRVEPCR
jgi:hypothetical protein